MKWHYEVRPSLITGEVEAEDEDAAMQATTQDACDKADDAIIAGAWGDEAGGRCVACCSVGYRKHRSRRERLSRMRRLPRRTRTTFRTWATMLSDLTPDAAFQSLWCKVADAIRERDDMADRRIARVAS